MGTAPCLWPRRFAERSRGLLVAAAVVALAAAGCTRLRAKKEIVDGQEAIYPFLSHGSVAIAAGMLENRWDIGNRYPVVSIDPLTWTEDPFNDNYWRFLFYSLRPTSNLLWAYYVTGQSRYREKLLEILTSFAAHDAQRPTTPYDRLRFDYRHGAGFRALVLVNTYMKLRRSGDLPADLGQALVASIERLGRFLALPENFDATYNHGFAEAAGLVSIAVNFPELAPAAAWKETALTRLKNLMTSAVDADGVELENSPFYHYYVLGFAYDISHWARTYAVPVSSTFDDAMRSMLRYSTLIVQPNGQLPLLGSTVEYGVENLDETAFDALAGENPTFEWVLSRGAHGTPPEDAERAVVFPVSGQSILRSGFGTGPGDFAEQSQVTFNVGPWRSNHSHLDVLGINLFARGDTLLCDSGLYTYTPGADADYFTGTRAHNTVVVDGRDQSPTGSIGSGVVSLGSDWESYSGWHGLYAGVTHRRSVLLLGQEGLLVVDALEADAGHDFAQTWHLPAGYTSTAAGLDVDAQGGGVPVSIRQAWTEGVTLSAITGATSPIMQGWVSTKYGQKTPSTVLEYHVTGTSARFATFIAVGAHSPGALQVSGSFGSDGTVHVTVCEDGVGREITLLNQASASEAVRVTSAAANACP